jgi:urease accessory protein
MKNLSTFKFLFASIAILLVPSLAHAHTGLGTVSGFGDGFAHPLSGADHVLAMVAVGIWAFQSGGRSVWAIPSAFVGLMLVGGVLGMLGVKIPFVEQGILLSVLFFGVMIAAAVRFPLALGMVVTGLFAVFHGHSHGTEIAQTASGLSYSIGFSLATATLHLTGIGMASMLMSRRLSPRYVQATGFAVALGGVCLYLL